MAENHWYEKQEGQDARYTFLLSSVPFFSFLSNSLSFPVSFHFSCICQLLFSLIRNEGENVYIVPIGESPSTLVDDHQYNRIILYPQQFIMND